MDFSWPDSWSNDPENSELVEWFEAVASGDTSRVVELLDSGVDVDARDFFGRTAFTFSVSNLDLAMARLLMDRGADPDDPCLDDTDGPRRGASAGDAIDPATILVSEWFAAVGAGDLAKAVELLDSGVDINTGDSIGTTAMMRAVSAGHSDLIRLLLARGASLEPVNAMRYTALTFAIHRARPWGDSGGIFDPIPLQILLDAGARYRLHEAVLTDDIPMARQRLEDGADPDDGQGSYEGPILMIAARAGRLGMVSLLLDHGANIEGMDDLGNRPLIEAASNGQTEVVGLLLRRGAELDAVNWSGQSALSEAALRGHGELYDYLRSIGAKRGLAEALVMNDLNLVTTLLDAQIVDQGEDIEWLSDGRQPLSMLAVERGKLSSVRLLLDRGASTTPRLGDRSLLAQAAKHGQFEIARFLIDRGADIHAAGRDGLTPLAWAIQAGHHAVADLLREAGATH